MKNILFVLFSVLLVTSCYEETDWVEDNSTTNGHHFPMIQDVIPESDTVQAGATVAVNVYFWSRDEVKELDFLQTINGTETLLSTSAPQVTYDEERNVDVMNFSYTVPDTSMAGSSITLTSVVRTVHDLTRSKSASIVVAE